MGSKLFLFILCAGSAIAENCWTEGEQSFGVSSGTPKSNLEQIDGTLKGRITYDYRINGVRACEDTRGYLSSVQLQVAKKNE